MTPRRQQPRTSTGRPGAWPLLLAAAAMAVCATFDGADAKTPGRSYCFLGRCHRVLTLAETQSRLGKTETLRASFYDDCARDRFNPCALTSSGEVFRPAAPDNAASPIYPDGTMLLLFHPETGAAAAVRVNNAGPYHSSRLIDVSAATADALGFRTKGLADLEVRVIAAPRAEEAIYRRLRRYWPVHGPIGRHGSIADAHAALVRASELPRVPARADAAALVALPATAVAATPPGVDERIPAADAETPALIAAVAPERVVIAAVALAGRHWLPNTTMDADEVPASAAGRGAFVHSVAAGAGLEHVTASLVAGEPSGLLASLRARARFGVKPGRLPDVGLGVAVAWLRETAVHLAAHARIAARARIAPRGPARMASFSEPQSSPGLISRR